MGKETLYDAIRLHATQPKSLIKHLTKVGVRDWADLTRVNLYAIRDEVRGALAPSTCKTYCSDLCTLLDRYVDEEEFCKDFRKILIQKKTNAVQKIFLTPKELKDLERVTVKSRKEAVVLHQFLIGAYTGMRWSDVQRVTKDNVKGGVLTYVSQKTKIKASVPVSQRTIDYIFDTKEEEEMCQASYNNILWRLCMRAHITEQVKKYHRGKEMTAPKWRFVSSHTARVSFCTNLANAGVPIVQIAQLAGHSNTTMTERYIVRGDVHLSDLAMGYLTQKD